MEIETPMSENPPVIPLAAYLIIDVVIVVVFLCRYCTKAGVVEKSEGRVVLVVFYNDSVFTRKEQ